MYGPIHFNNVAIIVFKYEYPVKVCQTSGRKFYEAKHLSVYKMVDEFRFVWKFANSLYYRLIYRSVDSLGKSHYNDVIMSAMASQIASLTIVYSTVYSRFRSKNTSKLRVTGPCEGNLPVTGECLTQKDSNAENVSIWWPHNGPGKSGHNIPLPRK